AVIVATVRAMKMNGGVKKEDLGKEDVEAVKKGCANLGRHIENVRQFGVPAVVAINHFHSDTDAEIAAMKDYVAKMGEEAILCQHWAKGSAGIEELAKKVVSLAESGAAQFAPLYPDDMKLFDKIDTIVKRIYRGSQAIADKSVRDQLHAWEAAGYGNLPVCMAKTQYSFSTDPNLRGAPVDHVVPVREVRLAAGAGFVVAICGEIMTMP
ncbi:formate--tetrahydrofolate ligase, partial [Mesorhizobium sp. CC13]|uniref:formate--tetrahydrofolate ligase n=1 Tax=Mesorhizobium sp. CC13 TaxID=3029194 RepID=UPI003266FFA9